MGNQPYYHSTRGEERCSPKEAILKGIASDGGLFVWDDLDQMQLDLHTFLQLDYPGMVQTLFRRLLWDYSEEELAACAQAAYGDTFDDERITPLVFAGKQPVLELFHGPTSAFKDVALCMLPQLMSRALAGKDEKVMIVTATSGDTGKAALSGFQDAENIGITVFYPQGKVSAIQRLQMVTQPGRNVSVCAIEGNFDDAQSSVKALFQSEGARRLKEEEHIVLSSANSINIGRLIPQIVYYFAAYQQLLQQEKIQWGEEISFCVPTGNFGNVLAGYYAKLLGLPIRHLIVAANENKVLDDFLRTGIYDRNRSFHTTISPSMDILISSNLERMLYYMCGKDSEKIRGWMDELARVGRYQVDEETLQKIRNVFLSGHCDNAQTSLQIERVYRSCGYVMDPHTAVGSYVLEQLALTEPCVLLSTASPYKFTRDVLKALQVEAAADDFVCMEQLSELTKTSIPQGLYALKSMEERFSDVIEVTDMEAYVCAKAKEVLK
ncbi:threonine synthase [Amedibacillus dolichus]|uniref:Threonine synthase n=1 Tax=Amedibacillus dolichus TaxID=31971 RepID=A0ABT7UB19_9FIRM|nr:threonine synthase [Amedibacillus dolichus]MDM8156836.1 threonine synthase [Amedibacillus dolichus]